LKKRLIAGFGALVLVALGGVRLGAQATKEPGLPPSQTVPASARLWRSETTGNEYRVWTDKARLYVVWVNIPPGLARDGASLRSEFRRVGTKWVGTTYSFLPCDTTEAGEHVVNQCRLETRIEIHSLEADRITGRGESLKRFDCARCQILETAWRDFSWVPKEQPAGSRKQ
jgi:hypothetical protein